MPSSYDSYHGSSYHSSANSSYMNNAARTYYTRLSEKAAPPGTVHFHSNTESHYHQPAHYVRAPTTKVVQKVVHVREPAPPTHVIREKVIVREPVRQPPREVVRGVERNVVYDTRDMRPVERRLEERHHVRDRGIVRNVAEKGADVVWKALGGQSRRR